MNTKLIIAIDGPAGAGKSTTAKLVASQLGYLHIDTGAMYRAITLKVLRNNIDIKNTSAVIQLVSSTSIQLHNVDGKLSVLLDGKDVTHTIRTSEVTKFVSTISAIPEIRNLLVQEQRKIAQHGNVVLEGRDIGTVVFPNADVKIFMIANVTERATRRAKELEEKGIQISVAELEKEIHERDTQDSLREISPLKKAEDAIILDTTHLTIPQQVDFIVSKVKEKKYESNRR